MIPFVPQAPPWAPLEPHACAFGLHAGLGGPHTPSGSLGGLIAEGGLKLDLFCGGLGLSNTLGMTGKTFSVTSAFSRPGAWAPATPSCEPAQIHVLIPKWLGFARWFGLNPNCYIPGSRGQCWAPAEGGGARPSPGGGPAGRTGMAAGLRAPLWDWGPQ